MGLFKIYSTPETIGGGTTTPAKSIVNDANAVFVNSITGLDTNTGIRSSPFATISKASSYSKIIVIIGQFNENISTIGYNNTFIIGDSECANIVGSLNLGAYQGCPIYGIKTKGVVAPAGCNIIKCIIDGTLSGALNSTQPFDVRNNFIDTLSIIRWGQDGAYNFNNNTILNFNNYAIGNTYNIVLNSIILTSVDLFNFTSRSNTVNYPIFRNCLFRKAIVWKWNGVVIPINFGTYGNVAGDYIADVISGLYAYASAMASGQDKTYFLAMIPTANSSNIFYVGANGQTCKVVEDRPSVIGSKKIFNRYVNDSPVDYSLYLSGDNVALSMSDQLSHVGCYKANAKVLTFGVVMHVNVDGSDDLVTIPDMLISDGNGKFHVSTADSVQIRNRVRSDVFNFKRGFNLTAFQSQMKSGLGSRFSMGKFQPYNITTSPTLPQESIEILPYNDENTPSAFPRFSGMFNGECQMWYHTTGAKINQPVLFNDLQSFFAITTDKSLAEYGTWAVTNADFETYLLSSKTGVALRNIPVYYGKIELNLNYHI